MDPANPREGSRWEALGAGLILNLPGIWYLDAVKDIAETNVGTATKIVWILVFVFQVLPSSARTQFG